MLTQYTFRNVNI